MGLSAVQKLVKTDLTIFWPSGSTGQNCIGGGEIALVESLQSACPFLSTMRLEMQTSERKTLQLASGFIVRRGGYAFDQWAPDRIRASYPLSFSHRKI